MSDKLIDAISSSLTQCAPECSTCLFESHCGADPVNILQPDDHALPSLATPSLPNQTRRDSTLARNHQHLLDIVVYDTLLFDKPGNKAHRPHLPHQ
jgi:hypothetical protein